MTPVPCKSRKSAMADAAAAMKYLLEDFSVTTIRKSAAFAKISICKNVGTFRLLPLVDKSMVQGFGHPYIVQLLHWVEGAKTGFIFYLYLSHLHLLHTSALFLPS
jgi:hypothetical protein